MRGFFVTGTDTNVGKTYVTCAIARLARAGGSSVFAYKPIETGCVAQGDVLMGSDQEAVSNAAGDWQRGELRGAYRFEPPVAPLVAADLAGVTIDLARVRSLVVSQQVDLSLVEGAGGWRVPITTDADMSALAILLGYPVIIVARAGLGTINHSLLTIEAVLRDGCSIAGVVLSKLPTDEPLLAASNLEQIQRRSAVPVVLYEGDASVLQPFA